MYDKDSMDVTNDKDNLLISMSCGVSNSKVLEDKLI